MGCCRFEGKSFTIHVFSTVFCAGFEEQRIKNCGNETVSYQFSNDLFLFRHPTITFSIENQCMRAQEHQTLWSKDVLDGIVLSAVCNLEKVQAPIVTKEG